MTVFHWIHAVEDCTRYSGMPADDYGNISARIRGGVYRFDMKHGRIVAAEPTQVYETSCFSKIASRVAYCQ